MGATCQSCPLPGAVSNRRAGGTVGRRQAAPGAHGAGHRLHLRHAGGQARPPPRRPGSTAWRSSSRTSWCRRSRPPRCGPAAPTWACRSTSTSRSATSTPPSRSRCAAQPAPGRAQVRGHGRAGHGPDPGLLRRSPRTPSTTTTCIAEQLHALAERAEERGHAGRLRGARLGPRSSTPTSSPGRSCGGPTTPRSACAWTASTSCPAARTRRASGTSPARSCSSCSWPTPRTMDMDVLQWSRHYRLFPGQGAFDLPAFLGHVLAAGYTGPLSLEVFNDVFRQSDPRRAAVDAHRRCWRCGRRPLDGWPPRPGASPRPRRRRRPGWAGSPSPSWPSTRAAAGGWPTPWRPSASATPVRTGPSPCSYGSRAGPGC